MKKLLSAVFMMIMVITAATLSGSALAGGYQFEEPEDGLPVVYLSTSGEVNKDIENSNGKEYTAFTEAVKALGANGGYVVLLEDVTISRSYEFPGASNGTIIVRGRDDLDTLPKINGEYMCSLKGPYRFEYVWLNWDSQNDSSDPLISTNAHRCVMGVKGDPNSMKATFYNMESGKKKLYDNIILTGTNIEINAGAFSIRMANWEELRKASSIDITLNGGSIVGLTAAHAGNNKTKVWGTVCSGDVNITINGGSFTPGGFSFGNTAQTKFEVGGDFNFTVNGGNLTSSTVKPVTVIPGQGFSVKGLKIVDLINYSGDKAALASKFPASDWDLIMNKSVFVSQTGDDSAAGTKDAPVATLAKAYELLGSQGGVVSVIGTYTLDSVTEAARTSQVIFSGDTLVINGDYTIGGPTLFTSITLQNGTSGAIVAAGNSLDIFKTVSTLPDANGAFLDIFGGKRDELCVVKLSIAAGTYNNVDTIGKAGSATTIKDGVTILGYGPSADYVMNDANLVNTSNVNGVEITSTSFTVGTVAKLSPKESEGILTEYYFTENGSLSSIRANNLPYVRVEYYLYARDTDAIGTHYPTLTIGDVKLTSKEPLVTNAWGVAFFDMINIKQDISSFTFCPYGDATGINAWNKMYIPSITFSQGYNDVDPAYPLPDMTTDGDVVPYVFKPEELGLEKLPVVYYADGGVYSGDAEGSKSSLDCYGSIASAMTAIDKIGGGYIILMSDMIVNTALDKNNVNNFPKVPAFPGHTNMIILRGYQKDAKQEAEEGKIKFYIGGMPNTNGPIWLQNLEYCGVSKTDTGLQARGKEFRFGTPGGDYNDVKITSYGNGASIPYMIIGGGDGGAQNNIDISIYSGTVTSVIRTVSGYGGSTVNGDVNITIYGGDLSGAKFQNGHSYNSWAQTNGDYNLSIYGGKLPASLPLAVSNTKDNVSYITGDLNVKIAGNVDISALAANSITAAAFVENVTWKTPDGKAERNSNLGVEGTRTIDILDFEGDVNALIGKINQADFDVLNINCINLDDAGSDDNNGKTAATAVQTLAKAVELVSKGDLPGKSYSGKIVIANTFTVQEGEPLTGPVHSSELVYTGAEGATLVVNDDFILSGPSTFTGLNIQGTGTIIAAGHKLNVGEDVGADGTDYVDIVAGVKDGTVESTEVVINGGKFGDVKTGDSVTGTSSIEINGGSIYGDVVGGTSATDGEVGAASIEINGGKFYGNVTGGNEADGGVISSSTEIVINDGEFSEDTTITAGNTNADATVADAAVIRINGGDFSDMQDGQIQGGSGDNGNTVGISYKNYKGDASTLNRLIGASSFNTVEEAPAPKPVFTNKFIYIIESYGDPTRALTKAIPFKITQSAKQTSSPIVVSPKQLNLKVDGSDHVTMSLQTVVDTVDTIRFVPNHNPTKGSRIVVDGYNINGRGVEVAKYKYIEIVYYYTVPEGETPAVKNMYMDYKGEYNGKIGCASNNLVPNKWATAIIDLSEKVEGVAGNLKQYHFSPMGNNKKGTDVPVTQYIDIASLTFYTNKPSTTIVGGNAPSMKAAPKEEPKKDNTPKKPAKIEDIVVNVVNLKNTVDKSDALTAAQVSKDGMTVMEYTPNLDSAKDLRLEGYNCMGKKISLNEYQYLTMKVFVETKRTDVTFKPQVINCNGGVEDNPEKAKGVTWTSETALVPNQWTTVTLKIAPADPSFHITQQFHIAPIGLVKSNTMVAGEKFYLAEFVLSNKPPKAAGEAAEDEEVIEVEQEIIEDAPEVVVDGSKLIKSAGNYATFNSKVGEFDGKKVVMITPKSVPGALAIDGSAIFGDSEQTPDGALSLSTHRYAIISYYYKSTSDVDRTPEFELLGGRIQDKLNVVSGVVAKGTEALKKNEWATVVVKLSGNGKGDLTSGFNLKPFGNVGASALNNDDVLYIENITFVSNRP